MRMRKPASKLETGDHGPLEGTRGCSSSFLSSCCHLIGGISGPSVQLISCGCGGLTESSQPQRIVYPKGHLSGRVRQCSKLVVNPVLLILPVWFLCARAFWVIKPNESIWLYLWIGANWLPRQVC